MILDDIDEANDGVSTPPPSPVIGWRLKSAVSPPRGDSTTRGDRHFWTKILVETKSVLGGSMVKLEV